MPTSRRLSHVGRGGRARMVDVGAKPETAREAIARGEITVAAATRALVRARRTRKGDPLETARLAGIMAAKRTAELIPLCHPLSLTHIEVAIAESGTGYTIEATAKIRARTGVEMEALTAVAIAALTLYDMLKAADKTMVIGAIRLVRKRGGRSGTDIRAGEPGILAARGPSADAGARRRASPVARKARIAR